MTLENKTPAETFPKSPSVLFADQIEIHQSQPDSMTKRRLEVTLVAVIGGFRSDLSITRKTDGNRGCFVFKVAINENGGNRRLNLFSGNPFYPRLIIPGIRNLIAQ